MATRATRKPAVKKVAAKKKVADAGPEVAPQIVLDKIAAETISVPIIGTTPLLVNRFTEKAKRQMLDAMQGRKNVRVPKDPQAEYEASLYRLKDGEPGVPAVAFKLATVGAGRFYHGVTMVALKQCLFFRGEAGQDGHGVLVRIEGEHHMREDVVGVGRNGHDLRYRAEFSEWSAALEVTYITSMLTRASVLSLIDAGGMGVGVCEWRVEKGGDLGTYRIDPTRDVEVLS